MSTLAAAANPACLPRETRRPLWQPWLALAVLAVAGGLVYSNSFAAPFIYDGSYLIVANPAVKSLAFWTYELGGNRMIGFLSFALNYAVGGFDVWGYHAVNVAIHVAAAWTLYGLLRETLAGPRLAGKYGNSAHGLALAVALLWVVHPLQTQSVTYLYQRLEAQMALFYLLTLYTFARARGSRWPPLWYGLSVAACLLGMGTKEVMVTAPLAVLWYDRVFVASSWRELGSRRTSFYCCLFSTWIALALLMMTRGPAYSQGGALFVENVSPWQYALSQPGVILHYLGLSFWPDRLCLDYGWPVAETAGRIVPPLVAIGVLLALTTWAIVRRPAIGFVAGSFFLVLAPTSSIAPIKDLAFEHRMYLPLASLIVLVVLAGQALWQRATSAASRPRGGLVRAVPALVVAALAVALGCRTYARNDDYRSALAVWQDVVRKRPDNRVARCSLGIELLADGRVVEAVAELDKAIHLKPVPGQTRIDLIAHGNRGTALMKLGRWNEAIDDFNRAIEDFNRAAVTPVQSVDAYCNRGACYLVLNRFAEALADENEALKLKPDHAEAYINRAVYYFLQKDYDRAWADVRSARKFGGQPPPPFIRDLAAASGHGE